MSCVNVYNEIWRDIRGYEGLYQVSNKGKVRSLNRVIVYKNGVRHPYKERILKPVLNEHGYETVQLGRKKHALIHRLVADAFVKNPKPQKYKVINHKDENPRNNRFDNLEWCTQSYNLWYGSNSNRNSYKRKPVLQKTMDGVFVKKYESINQAAEALCALPSNIGNAARGFVKSSHGYKWEFV